MDEPTNLEPMPEEDLAPEGTPEGDIQRAYLAATAPDPLAGFDRYWAELQATQRDFPKELNQVVSILGPQVGHTLVDAGCGEGWLARSLGNMGISITAIDQSPDLIEMARERAIDQQDVTYVHGDYAEAMKQLDDFSQDFVLSWAASWGYRRADAMAPSEAFFSEAFRVLNGGGKLLLQVLSPLSALVGGVSTTVNRCEDGTTVVEYLTRDALRPKLSLERWILGPDKAAYEAGACHVYTFEQLEEKLLRVGFESVQPVMMDSLFMTLVAVK